MALKLYFAPGACSFVPHTLLETAGEAFEPVLERNMRRLALELPPGFNPRAIALATSSMTAPVGESSGPQLLWAERHVPQRTKYCIAPKIVVNLQGDAPFTPPAHVSALLDHAKAGDVVTPVIRLSWDALDRLREVQRRHDPEHIIVAGHDYAAAAS